MKACLILPATLLSISCCFGQLKIDTLQMPKPETESVINFVKHNNFDYALVLWYTSNWITPGHSFYCFIKQNKQWYLVHISSPISPQLTSPYNKIVIKETALDKQKAENIYGILNPDAAFRYTQDEFNKLPQTCTYKLNDKQIRIYEIMDAGTNHLIMLDGKKITSLEFYAPDHLIENCGKYIPKLHQLDGFISTSHKLYELTK